MRKIDKQIFIDELSNKINEQDNFILALSQIDVQELSKKPDEKTWSVLECIEHMNLAMLVYISQFEKLSLADLPESKIQIGWIGNWFAEGMRPKQGAISNKIKTAKKLTPQRSDYSSVVSSFRTNLNMLNKFILANDQKAWNKTKFKTALGSLLKLNAGESFNFILAHNERHIFQIHNILTAIGMKLLT